MATRNVPTSHAIVDYGLPISATEPVGEPDAFTPPQLVSMGPPNLAVVVGRWLMVIAMLFVGLAAWRGSSRSGSGNGDAFWPVAGAAGVFVTVGFAGLVFWSVSLATNARRLTARAASPRGIGVAWLLVVAWVVISALTYLRFEVDAEFDPLPGLAGFGFAVCLALPYARLHSVFKGMTRQPPKLALHAYPLDLAAFGLVWWRMTSWPDPVTRSDVDHVRLTAYIAFGAAVALAVNALVFMRLVGDGRDAIRRRLARLRRGGRRTSRRR